MSDAVDPARVRPARRRLLSSAGRAHALAAVPIDCVPVFGSSRLSLLSYSAPSTRFRRLLPATWLVATVLARVASAQGTHAAHGAPRDSAASRATWGWGLQVTGLVTRMAPAISGRRLVEGYASQPHVMGHASFLGGRVAVAGTLNLEVLTLRRGELNPGMYGEGYVDRRHPHAYVHDLVASVSPRRARPACPGGAPPARRSRHPRSGPRGPRVGSGRRRLDPRRATSAGAAR